MASRALCIRSVISCPWQLITSQYTGSTPALPNRHDATARLRPLRLSEHGPELLHQLVVALSAEVYLVGGEP